MIEVKVKLATTSGCSIMRGTCLSTTSVNTHTKKKKKKEKVAAGTCVTHKTVESQRGEQVHPLSKLQYKAVGPIFSNYSLIINFFFWRRE